MSGTSASEVPEIGESQNEKTQEIKYTPLDFLAMWGILWYGKEHIMTIAQGVLIGLKIIELLQAMKKEESVEVRNRLVADVLPEASEDDVGEISRHLANIDPKFIPGLLAGIGEGLKHILGK